MVRFDIGSPGERASSGDKVSPFRPGSPYEGIPAVPPVDCSINQLRDYSMPFFAHLNAKVMELQRQQAQYHGQFAGLNLAVDKTLDNLKQFEGQINGQVMDAQTMAKIAAAKTQDIENDLNALKTQVEGVILDFHGHVGGKFSTSTQSAPSRQRLRHRRPGAPTSTAAAPTSSRTSRTSPRLSTTSALTTRS